MGIKGKILLPLLLLITAIGFYLYFLWLPQSVAHAFKATERQLQQTLEIVEDQLMIDLTGGDVSSAILKLDLMLLKNPKWKKLILRDGDGEIIYPVNPVNTGEEVSNTQFKNVNRDMYSHGKKIGSLDLLYDFSEVYNLIYKDASSLSGLIIVTLLIFTAISMALLYLLVIKPTQILSKVAEEISLAQDMDAADNIAMPRVTDDEIGILVTSFVEMQSIIKEKQKNLEINNKQLLIAAQKAKEANQIKTQFLANMSHELRTPLNSIIGFAKLIIEDDKVDVGTRDMLDVILKSSNSLLQIINDILDLSKIETRNLVLEEGSFDLAASVSSVLDVLLPLASSKSLPVNYKITPSNIPNLSGDSFRLERIITNLVGNAIKFTKKGDITVLFDVRELPNDIYELSCSVSDTGIGIPKNKMETIFENFSQADTSTTRKHGGTGLGLTITKELVEMMDGTLTVTSRIGRGSTFTFVIPFKKAGRVVETADLKVLEDAKKFTGRFDRKLPCDIRMLVAEDHKMNQLFIKTFLKKKDISNFDLVEDGVEAVEAYKNNNYDLILMDCHMPIKSGFEAVQEIRKIEAESDSDSDSAIKAHIPIIAMTADAMVGTREKCIEAGMNDYISKPVDQDEFKEILQKWVIF